jgi:NarL family two-component system response regulator LiaR
MEKKDSPQVDIGVLIADDHPIFRGGLRTLLTSAPGFRLVGEAASGRQAVEKAEQLKPDVILMDLLMPEMDGIQATHEVLAKNPAARILVLSSLGEDSKILQAIKNGAAGYILKESSPEELLQAIRQVHEGRPYFQPEVLSRLMRLLSREGTSSAQQEPLTAREQDVLKQVARGANNQEIALELNITENTVIKHISSILGKLNLENRTQAALYAIREGLAPLYPE